VKITVENQGILKRIQEQTSCYAVNKWEKEFKNYEKYLKNLCAFPLALPLNTSHHKSTGRRSSTVQILYQQ